MANKTIISIRRPTPMWANYAFRTVLLMATTLNTAIVSAPGITEAVKLTIVYWSGILVTFIWGLSRIIGVKLKEDLEEKPENTELTDPKDPPPPKP